MTALWWTSSYDCIAFLVAFFSNIAAIPVCVLFEMALRNVAGHAALRSVLLTGEGGKGGGTSGCGGRGRCRACEEVSLIGSLA
ncbi:hypothetical protein BC830DRAFT_1110018 [Chytriomyces sp. MP71]|nr:hypothetical protein BC830DRAFT_1110018 [Chytriomyces sp. MP71]